MFARLTALFAVIAALLGCNRMPSEADLEGTRGGRFEVMFNEPGTRRDNMWEPDVIDIMIDMIDGATATIDLAVMGFTRIELIDAFERAHDRGIVVRMVGDAGHLPNVGYQRFIDRQMPLVTGNTNHLMHNKFMIIDRRFVFGGTANWTDTDLRRNSNNFFTIDHPGVADDFQAEFDQLYAGAFGHTKVEIFNGRTYQVGDTEIEVWFSPNEDAMGRILELVDGAQDSVHFMIFAFTKDQVGSSFIRHLDRLDANGTRTSGVPPTDPSFKGVGGVIDRSQLHSNAQYHEIYRLLGASTDLTLDGNDNSRQPGDYQAGGGRMHSKTMVIDGNGMEPLVISGSFNWSSSATVSNDEFLLVMHGERVAQEYLAYFRDHWDNGKRIGNSFVGEDGLEPGDLVINEVQWYGVNEQDVDGNDEYIELLNRTDQPIQLDMWQIANPDDFVVGFPPGSIVQPNSTYLVLDHTLEPYVDGAPQDELSAYANGDLVVNAFNDNRQSRLYIKDGQFELFLKDPANRVMDTAGDGGPAFVGGPITSGGELKVFSMERLPSFGDGTQPESWQACTLEAGGANVNEGFRDYLVGTPGETNSP